MTIINRTPGTAGGTLHDFLHRQTGVARLNGAPAVLSIRQEPLTYEAFRIRW